MLNLRIIVTFILISILLFSSLFLLNPPTAGLPPGSRALEDSAWPCCRGDMRNTGLSYYDTGLNAGPLKWKFESDYSYNKFTGVVIGKADTIYFGDEDGYLYALYDNGTLKWKYDADCEAITTAPAIDDDGNIYFGVELPSYRGAIIAVDSKGEYLWDYMVDEPVFSAPKIDSDGTIYFGAMSESWAENSLYLYSLTDYGKLIWKTFLHMSFQELRTTVAIAPEPNKMIYISTGHESVVPNYGYLYAVNPNGTIAWKFQTETDSDAFTPAVDSEGIIYFGSSDYFYAVNPNGTQKWRFTTNAVTEAPAFGPDGTIYIAPANNYLYAISRGGHELWRFTTGEKYFSSPVVDSKGIIYVCGGAPEYENNYLYSLYKSGKERWKYSSGEDSYKFSPVIGEDGTIYISAFTPTESGFIYAINKGPPSSPINFQATPGYEFVNLTWEPPETTGGLEIVKYKIYKGGTRDKINFLHSVEDELFYNDTDVDNDKTYYYQIRAISEEFDGRMSDIISAIPSGVIGPKPEDYAQDIGPYSGNAELVFTYIDWLSISLGQSISGDDAQLLRGMMDYDGNKIVSSDEVDYFEELIKSFTTSTSGFDPGVRMDGIAGDIVIKEYNIRDANRSASSTDPFYADTVIDVTFAGIDKAQKQHNLTISMFVSVSKFRLTPPKNYAILDVSGLDNHKFEGKVLMGDTDPELEIIVLLEEKPEVENDNNSGFLGDNLMILLVLVVVIVICIIIFSFLGIRKKKPKQVPVGPPDSRQVQLEYPEQTPGGSTWDQYTPPYPEAPKSKPSQYQYKEPPPTQPPPERTPPQVFYSSHQAPPGTYVCPSCKAYMPIGKVFCGKCGYKILL